jgi:hypothetical protein
MHGQFRLLRGDVRGQLLPGDKLPLRGRHLRPQHGLLFRKYVLEWLLHDELQGRGAGLREQHRLLLRQ